MRRNIRIALWLLFLPSLVFSFVHAARIAAALAVALDLFDPGAVAAYKLRFAPSEAFVTGINAAVSEGDYSYAHDLVVLAQAHGHQLPGDVVASTQPGTAQLLGSYGRQAYAGAVHGNMESAVALSASLATDITGAGDLRDLIAEGGRWIRGEPYDPIIVTLAGVGLALTAAAVPTWGAGAVSHLGIAVFKESVKLGKMSGGLLRMLAMALDDAVDRGALRKGIGTLENEGVTAMPRAAREVASVIRHDEIARLAAPAKRLASIADAGDLKAAYEATGVAESLADLGKIERIAKRFGKSTATLLKFLGKSVLRLTRIVAELLMALMSLVSAVLLSTFKWWVYRRI